MGATDSCGLHAKSTLQLARIRAELPATRQAVYLNAGSEGPLPRRAVAAMRAWDTHDLRLGRTGPQAVPRTLGSREALRQTLARLLQVDPECVALTTSTTAGMVAATLDINWSPGDELVTTDVEHGGGLVGAYLVERRFGARVRLAAVGRRGGDISDDIATELSERTRLVSLSEVSWSTGARFDIPAIVRLCRKRAIPVLVDGAQSVGAIQVLPAHQDVDYYAFSGQKWLLGPNGTGGLYVAPHRLSEPGSLRPTSAVERMAHVDFWRGARRFERPFRVGSAVCAGLAASVGWLLDDVGLAAAFERAHALAGAARERLAALPGVDVVTPPQHGTLVSFRVPGRPAEALRDALTAEGIATRTVPELDALRLSLGFWLTARDLDRFFTALKRWLGGAPSRFGTTAG